MPWAFTGDPVDVGHGRYGRLDAGNGAEVPGMAQKRAEGLHLVAGRNRDRTTDTDDGWGVGHPSVPKKANRPSFHNHQNVGARVGGRTG